MTTLHELIFHFGRHETVWIKPAYGRITGSALQRLIARFCDSPLAGKVVGVRVEDPLELLCTLAVLDGLAREIVIIPAEFENLQVCGLEDTYSVDVVLNGNGLGLANPLLTSDTEAGDFSPGVLESRPRLSTTWWLPTSGTTGVPKHVAHSSESLTKQMRSRHFGDSVVWGSLYGLTRFAGLQVMLQALVSRSPFVTPIPATDLTANIEVLASLGCNALSATPSMWRRILMTPSHTRLGLRQITLGGEIVDQPILDGLRHAYPLARIVHIYASTEAGVGFVVRDDRAGFPRSFVHDPPYGVHLRVGDEGRLWVRRSFKDAEPEWIDTGDVVEVVEDRIYFLGRANGSINVGGNKVMPEEIEQTALELPEIALAVARPRKSALLGSLVELAVETAEGVELTAELKRRVIAHCRSRLESYKVPAFVVPLTDVRLSDAGKLLRRSI